MSKIFYRIGHKDTYQGLWYDIHGNFTGLIHHKYSFCHNSNLSMDFDEDLVGYLSAVESLEDLFKWFPKEDIIRLQDIYEIQEYEVDDYKWYERHQHWAINKGTSKLMRSIQI